MPPDAAVQVLTMLLAAARADGVHRETEVLITQLPVATAWLTGDLVFRKVSRPFLELFALAEPDVTGRPVHTEYRAHETAGAWWRHK